MFTGIVQELGRMRAFTPAAGGGRLEIDAPGIAAIAALGESVAVNGCCLTVVAAASGCLAFDVLAETARLTNLGGLSPGDPVNLEPSLRADGRLGGHFVTGHIDGMGTLDSVESRGEDVLFRIRGPESHGRLLVQKGSIAVDGVSLTVAEVNGAAFSVWLIPHTRSLTTLGVRRVGDRLNLEYDLLGKYVAKMIGAQEA
jgi:riboflavin synthase